MLQKRLSLALDYGIFMNRFDTLRSKWRSMDCNWHLTQCCSPNPKVLSR